MTWVKLDDQFFVHRKIIGLSKDAKLFFLAATAHSSASLLDGVLSPAVVRVVLAITDTSKSCIEELKSAGLFQAKGADLIIHDYLEYNPSASEVIAERDAAKERSRKNRRDKQGTDDEPSEEVPPKKKRTSGEHRSNFPQNPGEVPMNDARSPEELPADFDQTSDEVPSKFDKSSEEVRANESRTFGQSSPEVREKFEAPVPGPESQVPAPNPEPEKINTAAAENLAREGEPAGQDRAGLSAEEQELFDKLSVSFENRPALERADILRLICAPRADEKASCAVVRRQIRYWPYRKPSSNPRAFLIKAIEEDWEAPPEWIEAKKQHDERETRNRKRDQARAQSEKTASDADEEFSSWWSSLAETEQSRAKKAAIAALSKNPALKLSVRRCQSDGIDLLTYAPIAGAYRNALREALLVTGAAL